MLYVSKMNKMCLNYENKVKTLIVNNTPITTKRTTTHLKLFNTHTHTPHTHTRSRHMTLEIQVLTLDRHKHMGGFYD